jgi:hypothetical protein
MIAPNMSKGSLTKAAKAAAATAEPPKTLWEKTLNYTPVVMTVIATLLAGMSNSELSAAQYERSAAAQYQSKADDQWNYFQGKKLRGIALDNTLDLVQTLGQAGTFDAAAFEARVKIWGDQLGKSDADDAGRACAELATTLSGAGTKEALAAVGSGPQFTPKPIADAKVRAATDAIGAGKPDADIATLVKAVDAPRLTEAMRTADENSKALDAAVGSTNKALESLRPPLEKLCAAANMQARAARNGATTPNSAADSLAASIQSTTADFAAARLRFGSRRYALEAPLNQELALLTEIQVHQANIEADHHRQRSRLFFVGSLIAQAAVIGATLALAMKQKNLLWALAAIAGLAAVSFGLYVRLFV